MNKNSSTGFTIVELLIVVVVIAILAAITVVSYNGISNSAVISTLKNNLQTAGTKVEVSRTLSGGSAYPTSLEAAGFSGSNQSIQYQYSRTTSPDYYCITATSDRSGIPSFFLSSDSGSLQEGVCPGHDGAIGTYFSWKQVSAGQYFTCGIGQDDRAYCWGNNSSGRLGDGTTTQRTLPTPVATNTGLGSKKIIDISAGSSVACAVTDSGEVYCWGDNSQGQLGNGTTGGTSSTPVRAGSTGPLSTKSATSVSVASFGACARTSSGEAFCWGNNSSGYLGDGTTTNTNVPVAVKMSGVLSGKSITKVSTSGYHSCVLTTENKPYCWGYNSYQHLGDGTNTNSSEPVAVITSGALNGKSVIDIATSRYNTIALASDGTLYCWGVGNGCSGSFGDGTPALLTNLGSLAGSTPSKLFTSNDDSNFCVTTTQGGAYCWGASGSGTGTGSSGSVLAPTELVRSGAIAGKQLMSATIGSSAASGCGLASNGSLFCWGWNDDGNFGNGTTNSSMTPVRVSNPSNY